jgi:eukaryotic-like serine/threonine-protein kinase
MSTDRNLLFGILALQMDFIRPDDLIRAMSAWILDKARPIGQILAEQGSLPSTRQNLIDNLVDEHLHAHGDDAGKSIAAVTIPMSVRRQLLEMTDPEMHDTLSFATDDHGEATGRNSQPQPRDGSRYAIIKSHARGGIGEIFIARDAELKREVALKEIQPERANDLPCRARFLLEAEITAGLEHPGVVPIYGLGTHPDGRPYYAMRFIRGDSLLQAIRRFHEDDSANRNPEERSLALRGLLRRFVDVCNAIAYAHSRGVLHRDLKPGNVMLGKYGETLVVDWGLAKARGQVDTPDEADTAGPLMPESRGDATPTAAGAMMGTHGYMAPEQAAGRLDEVGATSDIYSLGATLYHLLVGRPSLRSTVKVKDLGRVQESDVPPPRKVNPLVPRALEAVCLKAMALQPADRYQTALELADDVEHWLADDPVAAYRDPWIVRAARWSRRHRTAVAGAAAFLITAVLALAATTALVWRAERATAAQERKAVEYYNLAREQNYSGFALIEAAEPSFASVPALHIKRREFLEKASKAFQQYLDEQPDNEELQDLCARVLRYTANVCRSENDYATAEPLYRQAVALYTTLAREHSDQTTFQLRLSEILRDSAGLRSNHGELSEAAAMLREAVELAEAATIEDAQDNNARRALAANLLALSAVEGILGKSEESGADAKRAADLLRALGAASPNAEAPYDPLLLAGALNNLAMAERDAGRIQAAVPLHAEAVKLLDSLVSSRPAGIAVPDFLHIRSLCRLEQCLTLAKIPASRANAEKNLSAMITQWGGLAAKYARIPAYKECLAVAHQERGSMLIANNKLAEAAADYERSRQLLESLVQTPDATPAMLGELGRAYLGLGRLAQANKENDKARIAYKKALEALDKATTKAPAHARNGQSRKEVSQLLVALKD